MRSIVYTELCQPKDVIDKATTIRTFNRQIWVNLWNGYFGLLDIHANKVLSVVPLNIIYPRIQTVAVKNLIVAKRKNLQSSLKFIDSYPIAKRK